MKKIIILLILIIYNISYVKGQDIESLLNELDHTIKNRESDLPLVPYNDTKATTPAKRV